MSIFSKIGKAWHNVTGGASGKNTRNIIGGVAAAATGAGFLGAGPLAGFAPTIGGKTVAAGLKAGTLTGGGAAASTAHSLTNAAGAAKTLSGFIGPASAIHGMMSPEPSMPTAPQLYGQGGASVQGGAAGAAASMLTPEFQDVFNTKMAQYQDMQAGGGDFSTFDKLRDESLTRVDEEQAERGRFGSSDTDLRRADTSATVDLARDQYMQQLKQTTLQELMNIYGMGTQADQMQFNQSLAQAGINTQYDMNRYNQQMQNRRDIQGAGASYLAGGTTTTENILNRIEQMFGRKEEEKSNITVPRYVLE